MAFSAFCRSCANIFQRHRRLEVESQDDRWAIRFLLHFLVFSLPLLVPSLPSRACQRCAEPRSEPTSSGVVEREHLPQQPFQLQYADGTPLPGRV